MKKIFIIEHLEPKLWKWCLIEYENISKIVGNKNLWFTNIKKKDIKKLKKFGRVYEKSVRELKLKKVCVLDPQAEKIFKKSDGKKFDYFVFGGILGDNPPKKRTKKELTNFLKNAAVRNIGKKQFPTDNAVFVVNEILKGKEFRELKFKNKFELKINEIESVILPFHFVSIDGKPLISKKIISYLKNKKGF